MQIAHISTSKNEDASKEFSSLEKSAVESDIKTEESESLTSSPQSLPLDKLSLNSDEKN